MESSVRGKRAKVIFLDGENHYSKKVGTIENISNTFVFLKGENNTEIIPISRVIRIEIQEVGFDEN